MPRSLVSYWKRVATSGTTADNREITPQELREVAETYKPSFYTAVIWSEHERAAGAFGTVFAVRLIEDDPELEPGQVALEAQLKPNDRLLCLNDAGEKLFSSVEITPNFRGRGKAYLTGFAVTDEPASIGTQELYFSKKTSQAAYFAASVELGQLRDDTAAAEGKGLITALTEIFKRFATLVEPAATPTPQTPTKSTPPMDEATAKALAALLAQLLIVAGGIKTLIEPATEEVEEDPETEETVDAVTGAVQDILDKADEEREFSKRRKGTDAQLNTLAAAVAGLEKQFNTLLNTPKTPAKPRTPGAVVPAAKRVL